MEDKKMEKAEPVWFKKNGQFLNLDIKKIENLDIRCYLLIARNDAVIIKQFYEITVCDRYRGFRYRVKSFQLADDYPEICYIGSTTDGHYFADDKRIVFSRNDYVDVYVYYPFSWQEYLAYTVPTRYKNYWSFEDVLIIEDKYDNIYIYKNPLNPIKFHKIEPTFVQRLIAKYGYDRAVAVLEKFFKIASVVSKIGRYDIDTIRYYKGDNIEGIVSTIENYDLSKIDMLSVLYPGYSIAVINFLKARSYITSCNNIGKIEGGSNVYCIVDKKGVYIGTQSSCELAFRFNNYGAFDQSYSNRHPFYKYLAALKKMYSLSSTCFSDEAAKLWAVILNSIPSENYIYKDVQL